VQLAYVVMSVCTGYVSGDWESNRSSSVRSPFERDGVKKSFGFLDCCAVLESS
jgi:hypothetical protein